MVAHAETQERLVVSLEAVAVVLVLAPEAALTAAAVVTVNA
jgi:hypothetical protein